MSEIKFSKEEIEGVWIKIYSPRVEGVSIVRDVYYPQWLQQNDYKWKSLKEEQAEATLSSEIDPEELKKEIVEGFDSFLERKQDYSVTPPSLDP
jgi:hypothetical protein